VTFGFFAATLAQLLAVAVVGWIVSDLFVQWLERREPVPPDLGLAERALLGVAGFSLFCVALMVLHLVTGGAVFGAPVVVPILGVLLLVAGFRRVRAPREIPWLPLAVFAFVLLAIFVVPDLRTGSGVRTGDPPWHLGWTQQLLHGEATPTGPAPEFGRNAYPWGLHAVMATMTRLVPGSTPLQALEALHILLVFSIPLAAACLARRVRRDSGWAAAIAASLIGGWGWLLARDPAFVTSPSQARYGADLVVASPNSVYELFPPALPRELGLVLLAAFGVLLAHSLGSSGVRWRVASGVVAGMVGLISVPMFVSALVWTLAASVIAPKGERLRSLVVVVSCALGVFALWAGPVVTNFVRFGGFVDITPQLGKEWPLVTSFGSWGLLLPFALGGVALVILKRGAGAPIVAAFAVGTFVLLGFALAREAFSWKLAGNATLLHQGRVWPPAHLLGAAFAGVAAAVAFRWVWERRRSLAAAGAVVIVGVGAASPALASVALTDVLRQHEDGFVYGRDDLAPGSFVERAAALLGPDDVVGVHGSASLAFHLFEASGCRLSIYDDPRLDGNDLRIRYADLAAEWDAKVAGAGFAPDWSVVPREDAVTAAITGEYEGRQWALVNLDTQLNS
jgi:hypothetical protein